MRSTVQREPECSVWRPTLHHLSHYDNYMLAYPMWSNGVCMYFNVSTARELGSQGCQLGMRRLRGVVEEETDSYWVCEQGSSCFLSASHSNKIQRASFASFVDNGVGPTTNLVIENEVLHQAAECTCGWATLREWLLVLIIFDQTAVDYKPAGVLSASVILKVTFKLKTSCLTERTGECLKFEVPRGCGRVLAWPGRLGTRSIHEATHWQTSHPSSSAQCHVTLRQSFSARGFAQRQKACAWELQKPRLGLL